MNPEKKPHYEATTESVDFYLRGFNSKPKSAINDIPPSILMYSLGGRGGSRLCPPTRSPVFESGYGKTFFLHTEAKVFVTNKSK